ncbi:aminoglycoside phosphotransferase family protein [Phytohabitans sp. LJ34]|uniref:aminoglycoside phosphotransferase family protein n=1 Tax=Phytohabitans sp. LJ34 TaxID=3452217 RepID=UPI003F8AA2D7
MDTPAAEVDIDASLVTRLVRAQHPDLDGPLWLVANGWDNAIYRLGDDLCVRLPRRALAVDLIRNEQRWLPALAARAGGVVPAPVRAGVPGEGYPWPWSICPWFEGRPAADVSPAERGPAATDLAEFLARLHAPAPADAPHNPWRGVPLTARDTAVRERLAGTPDLLALWERLVSAPVWGGPRYWLHGDLHPGNLVLAPSGPARLAAVIDFGDLTGGDPASDLSTAWLTFDAAGRAAFRARYDALTGTDADTWVRARGWALNLATAIGAFSDDSPRLAAISAHALAEVRREP